MTDSILIESDDPDLVPLLRGLEEQVRDAGGYLSPQLKVVISEGRIKVESAAPEGTELVRLPGPCLPAIDAVEFELSDGQLVATSYPEDMRPSQRSILDCMLGIYNRGHKLAAHRSESPWLALAEQPALLEKLLEARRDAPKLSRRYAAATAGVDDALLIEDFLGTRTSKFQFDDDNVGLVLMPFIDFFNHHSDSPAFATESGAVSVQVSHPITGSVECCVRYNRLDALDAFASYGFADITAPFVRSVPLRFELPDNGVVEVLGRVGRPRKRAIPERLEFLRGWIPRFRRAASGAIVANQLLIPRPSRIDVLANVLAVLFAPLIPGAGRDEMNALVRRGLETAIQVNHEYYRSFAERLELAEETSTNHLALQQLRRMVNFQLAWMDEWREALAAAAHAVSFPHTPDAGAGWA